MQRLMPASLPLSRDPALPEQRRMPITRPCKKTNFRPPQRWIFAVLPPPSSRERTRHGKISQYFLRITSGIASAASPSSAPASPASACAPHRARRRCEAYAGIFATRRDDRVGECPAFSEPRTHCRERKPRERDKRCVGTRSPAPPCRPRARRAPAPSP